MSEILNEEDLFEAVIPETRYGYWITAEGVFHVVGYQQHSIALRSLIGFGAKFGDAYDRSWIRVGSNVKEAPNMLFVQFRRGTLTARSLIAIRQLAMMQDFERYYLTVWTPGGEFGSDKFEENYFHRHHFLLAVQEQGRKPIPVAAPPIAA